MAAFAHFHCEYQAAAAMAIMQCCQDERLTNSRSGLRVFYSVSLGRLLNEVYILGWLMYSVLCCIYIVSYALHTLAPILAHILALISCLTSYIYWRLVSMSLVFDAQCAILCGISCVTYTKVGYANERMDETTFWNRGILLKDEDLNDANVWPQGSGSGYDDGAPVKVARVRGSAASGSVAVELPTDKGGGGGGGAKGGGAKRKGLTPIGATKRRRTGCKGGAEEQEPNISHV